MVIPIVQDMGTLSKQMKTETKKEYDPILHMTESQVDILKGLTNLPALFYHYFQWHFLNTPQEIPSRPKSSM